MGLNLNKGNEMLHEAYYPSEKNADQYPIKVLYGFVQEEKNLNLVVILPSIKGTRIGMLNEKTQADFFKFLLDKHVFRGNPHFIKVSYIAEDDVKKFEGYEWSFNQNSQLVKEPSLEFERIEFLLNELKK